MIRARLMFAAALACSLAAATAARSERSQADAGRMIAQRHCSGCHALSGVLSPNPNAPPFPLLYQHYAFGDLGRVLNKGQIASVDPPVEGEPGPHPRMSTTVLAPEQLAQLTAYLNSLDPRRLASRPRR